MANVSSAVQQAGNIFYLLVLFYVEENRYQEKFSMSIPNVVVGLIRRMISLGAMVGGAETRMCT